MTAFEVDHGDLIKPAYGYRVDYDCRSVVISGDTRLNDNVIRYGIGADVRDSRGRRSRPELLKDAQVQRVIAHHASPQDAGRVLQLARPRLAVYTHLVLLARPEIPAVTTDELVAQTREVYDGPLVVGQDLMAFTIGKSRVEIVRPHVKWPYDRIVMGRRADSPIARPLTPALVAVLLAVFALAPSPVFAWNCPVQIRAAEEAIKRAEAMKVPPEAKPLVEDAKRLLAEARKHHAEARAKIDHANAMWKAKAAAAEADAAAAISTP